MNRNTGIIIAGHPIELLQEKIQELQTALFFSLSNAVLKISSHVVTSAVMDETGQIWFAVPRPVQNLNQFETEFPTKLDFFKKGKEFFLKIEGNASIVTDYAEMTNFLALDADILPKVQNKEYIVIKVKIQLADYFQAAPKPTSMRIPSVKIPIYNWLVNKQDRAIPQLVRIPVQSRYSREQK